MLDSLIANVEIDGVKVKQIAIRIIVAPEAIIPTSFLIAQRQKTLSWHYQKYIIGLLLVKLTTQGLWLNLLARKQLKKK